MCKSAGNYKQGTYQPFQAKPPRLFQPVIANGTYTLYTGLPLRYCPTITVNCICNGEPERHSVLVAESCHVGRKAQHNMQWCKYDYYERSRRQLPSGAS